MEDFARLLEEGRHVEFVEELVEALKRDKKRISHWCEEYIKDKEVPEQERALMDLSCVFGVYLAKTKGLKTTQIRKVLEGFNRIECDYKRRDGDFKAVEVIKLKPALAYTSARSKESKELIRVLDSSINKIIDGKDGFRYFEKICEFLRGVVAYHKLAGGGD